MTKDDTGIQSCGAYDLWIFSFQRLSIGWTDAICMRGWRPIDSMQYAEFIAEDSADGLGMEKGSYITLKRPALTSLIIHNWSNS